MITHCSVLLLTSRSRWIDGSATFTIAMSSTTMNWAAHANANTMALLLARALVPTTTSWVATRADSLASFGFRREAQASLPLRTTAAQSESRRCDERWIASRHESRGMLTIAHQASSMLRTQVDGDGR